MMRSEEKITRKNALEIIKKFAKEYRKELGKVPGEIIFVGGGSIVLNYKFRDATQDFDVILKTVSGVRDVITKFADDNGLPRDWMNSDFTQTPSFSTILSEVSTHYCSLNNGTLEIRTVTGVYLAAMKLRARRAYRNDISDAIGILIEEREAGNRINFEDIQAAYFKLYSEDLQEDIAKTIKQICSMNLATLKNQLQKQYYKENEIGCRIIRYIDNGANIDTENIDDVVSKIKAKMNKP